MKPKNQHIPITKFTYIYLIRLPSKQFINYWVNPPFSEPHCNTHDYPPVNNVLPTSKILIPLNYLHLLEQFIDSSLGITRVSKISNHSMNNITNRQIVLLMNSLQMLMILFGGTEIQEYRFLVHFKNMRCITMPIF